MSDFFGYERKVRPNGTIATSELATIKVGGNRISLVQNVNASYQQMVAPKFEAGSATLYWVLGQPQGTIQMQRLVGNGGFLDEFRGIGDNCGELTDVSIGLDGDGCAVVNTGSKVAFRDAVPESVSISFNVGGLQVAESLSLRAAFMDLQ